VAAPDVQLELNLRQSSTRKQSPFFTLYGFQPRTQAPSLPHPILVYSDPAKRHYQVAENLTRAKHQQIVQANNHRRPAPPHHIGQQVKLSTKNLPERYHVSKISPKWVGPFTVTQYNPWAQNVTLDFSDYPDLNNISNSFNTSVIAPYHENPEHLFPGRTPTKPEAVSKDRYEVEKLLEFRSEPRTGKMQYLVKWKDWPTKYNQWVYAEDEDGNSNIDESLKQEFWLHGSKTATYKRRKVNKPGKAKTRQETLQMINAETEKVLKGKTVSFAHNYVNNFIDDLVFFLDVGKAFNTVYEKLCFYFGEGIM